MTASNPYISRTLALQITQYLKKNKVLLLLGTRRVGKTHLTDHIKTIFSGKIVWLHGEDSATHDLLVNRNIEMYKNIVSKVDLLIIDEAQVIPEIGKILKLFIDHNPHLCILASGSSSFDLLNKSGEPLTGRSQSFFLYPFSIQELLAVESFAKLNQTLDEHLVFGSYPELYLTPGYAAKENYLKQLIQGYLLKDILSFNGIKESDKILKLLKLIAYQIGSEVSYLELGQQLGMSKNTVEHYLDLLSKVFIVFKLSSYSSNLRKEVSKGNKWYFYDNGVRNAIIQDFRLAHQRQDMGALWENFAIAERIKYHRNNNIYKDYYFWRTYDQQEVDFLEIANGEIQAYECKYQEPKRIKTPVFFAKSYPQASFGCIHKYNLISWVTGKE